MKTEKKLMVRVIASALLMMAAACGGGGGGKGSPDVGSTNTQGNSSLNQTVSSKQGKLASLAADDKEAAKGGAGAYVGLLDTGVWKDAKGIPSTVTINSKVPKEVTAGGDVILTDITKPVDEHGTAMVEVIAGVANSVTVNSISHDLSNTLSALRGLVATKKAGAKYDVLNNSFGSSRSAQVGVNGNPENLYGTAESGYSKFKESLPDYMATQRMKDVAKTGTLVLQATGNVSSPIPDLYAAAPLHDKEMQDLPFLSVTAYNRLINGNNNSHCGELTKNWCLAAPSVHEVYGMDNHKSLHGGTSNATAFVSGVAAQVKSRYDWATGMDLKNILLTTTDDIGQKGVDSVYGHGLVNSSRAMNGYGRFDGHVTLNVDGAKKAYFFDNNISGSGGMTKQGKDILVMNGNNTYTGNTTVAEGELVLNGSTRSNHTVKKGAVLSTGDSQTSFDVPNVANSGTLDVTTAGLNVSGNLTSNGTIKTAIGSDIKVAGNANLDNTNIYLAGVKKGVTVSKAGTQYNLVEANSMTANGLSLDVAQSISNLVDSTYKMDGKNLSVTVKRQAIGDVLRNADDFTGKDKIVQQLDGLLDNVDKSKLSKNSTNSTVRTLSEPVDMAANKQDELYNVLLNSQNLQADVYRLTPENTVRAQENISNLKADRIHDLSAKDITENSEVWVSAGQGQTKINGLKGIQAKSSDNAQFLGFSQGFGSHGLAVQVGNLDYDWNESFSGVSKSTKTKGVGVDGVYQFKGDDLTYRVFASYDKLKPKNGSDYHAFLLGGGLSSVFDYNGLGITPYLNIFYTGTGKGGYTVDSEYDVKALNVQTKKWQAEFGSRFGYAFGTKNQFALTGDIYARRTLTGKAKFDSLVSGNTTHSSERAKHQTNVGVKLGGTWNITDNVGASINAGYEKGSSKNIRQSNATLSVKF